MAGIVGQTGGRMIVRFVQKHLIGGAVEQVRSRVKLIAEGHPVVRGHIQDRLPEPDQFIEGFIDDAVRPLGPGVDHVPGKPAGHARDVVGAHVDRGRDGFFQLIRRPGHSLLFV